FLKPKPGTADDSGRDIRANRHRETKQCCAADDHQDHLERVERLPFQMTLTLQDQLIGDAHHAFPLSLRGRQCRPLSFNDLSVYYWTDLISVLTLSAWGPSSFARLSSIGSEIFLKPDLSTSVTILMPIALSLLAAASSSSNAFFGSCIVTSRPASSTHFFCSSLKLCQSLSLIHRMALFASCCVIESTGAGS